MVRIFVQEFPYQFDGNKEDIVQKNLIRVAETWMDGMRKYFYASTRVYTFKRAELDRDELKSLEDRKRLRQRLQCRNFEWYMYNIIPEVAVPPMNAILYGEIKNTKTQVQSLIRALILFIQTLALYKSFTYLLTYLTSLALVPLFLFRGKSQAHDHDYNHDQHLTTRLTWCKHTALQNHVTKSL